MVNHGPSGGCQTCKKRRIKCDEGQPSCSRCLRAGRQCGGYGGGPRKIRFKDQTKRFSNNAVLPRGSMPKSQGSTKWYFVDDTPLFYPLAVPAGNATAFFIHILGGLGRDLDSSRGFFETLGPALSSQCQESALALVVAAVSEAFLSLWKDGAIAMQNPRESFIPAMRRLRTSILSPIERKSPATILAVLVLQFHENLVAVYARRPATHIHYSGAEALLPMSEPKDGEKSYGTSITRYMASIEVSSATREKKPIQPSAVRWLDIGPAASPPPNPSATLDGLGAVVVDLQLSYTRCTAQSKFAISEKDTEMWRSRIDQLDQQLRLWAEVIPRHWHPVRLRSCEDFHSSIKAYNSVCDVYPSCQIASIWSMWRCYRLAALKLSLNLLQKHSWTQQASSGHAEDLISKHRKDAQDTVDSICYSVPFYLGNRTRPATLRDFSDPTIYFPSIHCLAPGDRRYGLPEQRMSKKHHQQHALIQGLWHVFGPLSRLLVLLSEEDGWLIKDALRPGQHDWIRQQFVRLNVLQHLYTGYISKHTPEQPAENMADELARVAQGGLCLTAGL